MCIRDRWQVCHVRQACIIHADQAGERVGPHERHRVLVKLTLELGWKVHRLKYRTKAGLFKWRRAFALHSHSGTARVSRILCTYGCTALKRSMGANTAMQRWIAGPNASAPGLQAANRRMPRGSPGRLPGGARHAMYFAISTTTRRRGRPMMRAA